VSPPAREVYLLQRKKTTLGKDLGKTSGWVHRATLKQKQVQMIGGVSYERIDDQGLHISTAEGGRQILAVDHVVICAGQEPLRALADQLGSMVGAGNGPGIHVIGGADVAAELDAKRAIDQGSRLAAAL
jgi:2,4-dienoyl-CoA reductase (NADPH2)